MQKIVSIQYLRAVAALMVLIFHCDRILSKFDLAEIKPFLEFGKYGLDVFFVISGFIMAYIYKNKRDSFANFAVKRLVRIYPVYLECLFIALVVIAFGFSTKTLDLDYVGSLFLIHPANSDNLILSAAWTLSYEFWFYLVFGLSMSIFGKKFWIGIICFALATFWMDDSFFFTYRNYEFCVGVFLALGLELKNKKEIPLLTLIGNASYSLYLLHIPLLEVFGKLFGKFSSSNIFFNLFWIGLMIGLIVWISILNYLFFEKKIQEKFGKISIKNLQAASYFTCKVVCK